MIKFQTKWIFWVNVYLFNFYGVYFAIIEENICKKKRSIYLVTIVRKKGNLYGNRASNSTNSFQNYEETKKLQAMKLYDQRTRSGR